MRVARLIPALLLPACSFFGVEPPPAAVRPDDRFVCTDQYWLPAADLVATAGAAALGAWTIHRDNEACARDRNLCDGQTGMAALFPVPFAVSSVVGAIRVRRCRATKSWQRSVVVMPTAGQNGAACAPV